MAAQSGIEMIVGLGNPGPDYFYTRHNAGFWLLDRLAASNGVSFRDESRFQAQTARGQNASAVCHLLKPNTFMNKSGLSVQSLSHYYKIPVENILVVHDEIDLDPGVIRLKKGGGHGGHNGLRNIISLLGGRSDFMRLRIGVGHPGDRNKVVDFVLHKPSNADQQSIDEAMDEAMAVMPLILSGEHGRAMQRLHSSR